MKLFADQSFPASIQETRTAELELLRWSSVAISDEELVLEAATNEGQGVIFLGVRSLLSANLRELASGLGLTLLGTNTTDPITGSLHVATHIGAIFRQVRAGAVLEITSRDVRPYVMGP